MDDKSVFRYMLPGAIIALIVAVWTKLSSGDPIVTANISALIQWSASQLRSINVDHLFTSVFDHLFWLFIVGFVFLFKTHIIIFIRKTVKKTDAQFAVTWYVSRYARKNMQISILTEEWRIRRSPTNNYWVKVYNKKDRKWKTSGKIIYSERDRFNILLTGDDHQQQSLICFQKTIAHSDDSRIIGIGAGDDAQYIVSSRVYFASQKIMPEDHIKAVLDDATETMISNKSSPILQLPITHICEVFGRHPVPVIVKDDFRFKQRLSNIFKVANRWAEHYFISHP